MARLVKVYPNFDRMHEAELIMSRLSLDEMAAYRGLQLPCSLSFRRFFLTVSRYSFLLLGGEGRMKIKYSAQEDNTMTRPSLEPRLNEPQSTA